MVLNQHELCAYIKKFLQEHYWQLSFKEKVIKFFKMIDFEIDNNPNDEIVFKKRYSDKYIIYVFSGLSKTNPFKEYYPMFYIDLYQEHRFIDGNGFYHPKCKEDIPCFFKEIEHTIKQYFQFIYEDALNRAMKEAKEKYGY